MDAIGALVNEHGHRRVRARIRDMLDHFLHYQGIANDEANHLRSVAARFFAQNRAVIQLQKQHQSYCAQAFLDCAFQLGKRARFVSGSPKFSHIRMTDAGIHTGYYFIKLLGSRQTEPLYLDFSYHLESFRAAASCPGCIVASVLLCLGVSRLRFSTQRTTWYWLKA